MCSLFILEIIFFIFLNSIPLRQPRDYVDIENKNLRWDKDDFVLNLFR